MHTPVVSNRQAMEFCPGPAQKFLKFVEPGNLKDHVHGHLESRSITIFRQHTM